MRALGGTYVHGDTADLGPAVALRLELVVGATSLQQGLVDTATASNDANHGTVGGAQDLLVARGQLDAGGVVVCVVGDDGGVVARCASNCAAVAVLVLHIADNGTLGQVADGQHVADRELGCSKGQLDTQCTS